MGREATLDEYIQAMAEVLKETLAKDLSPEIFQTPFSPDFIKWSLAALDVSAGL
jgi:hypothetical protein